MPARRKTRILLWSLLALLVAGAIGFVWLRTLPAPLESWLQDRVLLALREHYHGDVQLQNLHVTLIPTFRATADNFVLPNRGGPDLPSFILVKHLTAETGFLELLRSPIHLTWLKLDGLEIRVAPKRGGTPGNNNKSKRHMHLANFVIDKVDADGAELYILRKDPAKEPMQFDIRKLTLRSAGVGQPMTFQAELTNPTPPGLIATTGRFGPWNFDQPSATNVGGHYDFQHADLSVFNGISGILSSTGDYTGTLHNIVVDGRTDTPDFELDRSGQAVHLTTQFHAVVDGTNGNTYLQPVNAHFLNSNITVVQGEIAGKAGQKGKTIALDVDAHEARVEDFLTLAAKSDPPMLTGHIKLEAAVVIPPGSEPVLQKLLVNGQFDISDAKFTNDTLKKVIAELSRRGQGKPNDTSIEDVPAEFLGDFQLLKSDLHFSKLQFVVPGVAARMNGSYGLHTQQLDFVGDVSLNARVSQMVTGAGRWILLPFDLIFMKHGAGTYVPLSISGTRSQPQIKVNWKKLFQN